MGQDEQERKREEEKRALLTRERRLEQFINNELNEAQQIELANEILGTGITASLAEPLSRALLRFAELGKIKGVN